MPELKIKVDAEKLPSEFSSLKDYIKDGEVAVWVGDKVAEETNASLAANRDKILTEKGVIENKYNALVESANKDVVKLAEQIATLKTKQDSNISVSDEDKKIIDAAKKAGVTLTPEFVAEALKNYPVVNEKLGKIEVENQNRELFQASGYKNEKAFFKAIADKEANPKLKKFLTEKVTEGGKEVVKAYAEITKDDGTTEKLALTEYVKQADWSVYLPSLNGGGTQEFQPFTSTGQSTGSQTQSPNSFLDAMQAGNDKFFNPPKKAEEKQ